MHSNNGEDTTRGPAAEWENYIIPVFGAAIVLLILLVLCQLYSKKWWKYCCPRAVTTVSDRDGRESRTGREDLPPTYSVLTGRRTNFDVFQVEAVDDRSSHITAVTDKLPTYEEILERKKQKENNQNDETEAKTTENEFNCEQNYETISFSDQSSIESKVDLSDIFTTDNEEPTPPPYRPRTSGSSR